MAAMLRLDASDDGTASWHEHMMIIVIGDEDGGCSLDFLVTLRMTTSAVVADLRSAISRRGGQSW
jgi:hypothetical protein